MKRLFVTAILIAFCSICMSAQNQVTMTDWCKMDSFSGKTVTYTPLIGQWVIIVYRIQNNSDLPLSENYRITLIDSAGKQYEPIHGFDADWVREIQKSVESKYRFVGFSDKINPGDYAEFFVLFDIPKTSTPKTMRFGLLFDRDFKLDFELN